MIEDEVAAPSRFTDAFAAFYDAYGTAWTAAFLDGLVAHLAEQGPAPGRALDLACGSGVAAASLHEAGWQVIGVDASEAMLALAAERLAPAVAAGDVELVRTTFGELQPLSPVDLCIAAEGPLNYLASVEELRETISVVGRSLTEGGLFVFDLYEAAHFRRWHHIRVIDEEDAFVIRRGVWDDEQQCGMLRISGAFGVEPDLRRVGQTVTSRVFAREDVEAALVAGGLRPVASTLTVPPCTCGSADPDACRTLYVATKAA